MPLQNCEAVFPVSRYRLLRCMILLIFQPQKGRLVRRAVVCRMSMDMKSGRENIFILRQKMRN